MIDTASPTQEEACETFLKLLQFEAAEFSKRISTADGDWIVKGFIDVFRRIYTISGDTKVVSKLIELMLLPGFKDFADKNNYKLVLARQQNHYPDMSFVDADGLKFAVDLKSTFQTKAGQCNTMTLGAFSGYFRNRSSTSTTTFPYGDYAGHFVLGVVYNRAKVKADEFTIHTVRELATDDNKEVTEPIEVKDAFTEKKYSCETLQDIPAVVRDLTFFAQPKFRIARDRPGSGNTKNIGGIGSLDQLFNGKGPFSQIGEDIFNDYWMHYMTKADAKAAELKQPPYANLKEYFEYKKISVPQEAMAAAIAESETEAKIKDEPVDED